MKTLTFTIEDALLSDISLSMLTGAGLINVAATGGDVTETYVHTTFDAVCSEVTSTTPAKGKVDLTGALAEAGITLADIQKSEIMPIYAIVLDEAGGVKKYIPNAIEKPTGTGTVNPVFEIEGVVVGDIVRLDCYAKKTSGKIVNIEASKFAGYYYIEANTLFRDETTGQDFPAEFVIPRGKIQSNFTFTLASSGDPSTFSFTIDAFPAYTKFDIQNGGGTPTKVLAAIQMFDDAITSATDEPHYPQSA